MDKHGTHAFRVGERISELRLGAADYWIIYVDKGVLNITSPQETYRGASGQVLLIGLTNKEMRFCPEAGFSSYALKINDPASAELVKRYLLLMKSAEPNVSVFATGKQERSIRTVFQNIIAVKHDQLDSGDTILQLLLQELMARLFRTSPKTRANIYSNRSEVVSNVRALLEKEYSHPLKLEAIAGRYNMSVSYLSHIFKEITGISLMRYLLLVRVRVAKNYLVQTSLPINEIAEKSGFNDMSNFGRTFKNETGYAPRQYRQLYSQQSDPSDK